MRPEMRRDEMTTRLAIFPLISAAWGGAVRSLVPAAPWITLFALAAGAYSWALNGGVEQASLILLLLAAAWGAGIATSWRIYSVLLAPKGQSSRHRPSSDADAAVPVLFGWIVYAYYLLLQLFVGLAQWLLGPRDRASRQVAAQLAHANMAVYGAFLFIGFFVVFFQMMLPGILMQEAGQYQLDKDTDPAIAQEAFLAMLATPFGAVFIACCLAGAGLLGWIALRLTLYGAATVATGKAHVFRTWGLTKGQLVPLGAASLATHILPFALGIAVNSALHQALPDTGLGHFIGGAAGVIVFAPFLLAGHAMAAAAWDTLKPAPAPELPPSSGG